MNINEWSSGKIKEIDPKKKLGIIEEDFGEKVIFSVEDFILPKTSEELSEKALVGQKVFFKKELTNFGSEAKKISIIDIERLK
jgi:hypothetical protein